jgi:hypothetical protein
MIDVFLCTYAKDPIRKGMFDSVRARWEQMGCDLTILDGVALGFEGKEFQGIRRQIAEDNAEGEIYILAEDDCMPLGKGFIEHGLHLMGTYRDYAVISPTVLNGVYEGPQYKPEGDLIRANGGGGINFTRHGYIPTKIEGFFDEAMQGEWLSKRGWKSGYALELKMNHLGAHLSTLWPDDYRSGVTQIA